jgi:hypothetical protein
METDSKERQEDASSVKVDPQQGSPDTKPESAHTAAEDAIAPASREQLRRARRLVEAAKECTDGDLQFILLVGALYLGRSVVEHWMTTVGEVIPQESAVEGAARDELAKRLRATAAGIFEQTKRFAVISEIRHWDYHWEPLINPLTLPATTTYGRGAPLRLSTGPAPNSSVTFLGGAHKIVTTGSGRQVGRKNYYRIHQNRFVDFETSQAVPLLILITEFLDDLPSRIHQVMELPEVVKYLAEYQV